MEIAALMGASGPQTKLVGAPVTATNGTDGEFKQALQGLIDGQTSLENSPLNGKNTNWLGILFKLFDQGSTLQVTPDPNGEVSQPAQETVNVSLTEIMTALQSLVDRSDATAMVGDTLTGEQSAVETDSADSATASEIDPLNLVNQAQLVSPASVTTGTPLPEQTAISIDSATVNLSGTSASVTPKHDPMATAGQHTNPVFVEVTNSNPQQGQVQGTSPAGDNPMPAEAAPSHTASSRPNSPSGSMEAATPTSSATSASVSTTPVTSDPATAINEAKAQVPSSTVGNFANQAHGPAETMKSASPSEPLPGAKELAGDTVETASPAAPASTNHTAHHIGLVKAAGGSSSGLSNAPALNQIVESIKLIAQQGESEVRLQLHPESLGQVLVRLHIKDGHVSVGMLAETMQAQTLIQEHLPQLKTMLASQGMQIQEMNVNVGSDASAFDTPRDSSHHANLNGAHYQNGHRSMFEDRSITSVQNGTSAISGLHAIDYQA